jgi:hypothetical protein
MLRTTLQIEDDVLRAAKAYAARRRLTLAEAVSELVRHAVDRPLVHKVALPGYVRVKPPEAARRVAGGASAASDHRLTWEKKTADPVGVAEFVPRPSATPSGVGEI